MPPVTARGATDATDAPARYSYTTPSPHRTSPPELASPTAAKPAGPAGTTHDSASAPAAAPATRASPTAHRASDPAPAPCTVTTAPPAAGPASGTTADAAAPSEYAYIVRSTVYSAPPFQLTSTGTTPAACAGATHSTSCPLTHAAYTPRKVPKPHTLPPLSASPAPDTPTTPPPSFRPAAGSTADTLAGSRYATPAPALAPPATATPPPTTASTAACVPAASTGASHRTSALDSNRAATAAEPSPTRHSLAPATKCEPRTASTVPPVTARGATDATDAAARYSYTTSWPHRTVSSPSTMTPTAEKPCCPGGTPRSSESAPSGTPATVASPMAHSVTSPPPTCAPRTVTLEPSSEGTTISTTIALSSVYVYEMRAAVYSAPPFQLTSTGTTPAACAGATHSTRTVLTHRPYTLRTVPKPHLLS